MRGLEESEFGELEIEVTAENAALTDFEDLLHQEDAEGLDFREAGAADPVLRSVDWQAVVISISSVGGLKVFRDVLVSYLTTRRAKLTVKNNRGVTVTFEGPLRNQREVRRLVDDITPDEPPE